MVLLLWQHIHNSQDLIIVFVISVRVVRIGGELPPREPPRCVELPKSRRNRVPDYVEKAQASAQNGKDESEEESEEESDEE